MFREMVRKKQQLTREEAVALLKKEPRGVLSLLGDDGYPYGTPMNHYYCEEDGCIYFHCGRRGHRLDALRRDSRASFCVCEAGHRAEGEWALTVRSVVVFGRVEIIDDLGTVVRIARPLCEKFTSDEAYIQSELDRFAKATLILKLTPEHLCGKTVQES